MPFFSPNQQCQCTEGNAKHWPQSGENHTQFYHKNLKIPKRLWYEKTKASACFCQLNVDLQRTLEQRTTVQKWLIIHCRTLLLHPFNGLFSRTTWVSRHQKGKPFWILLEQEMMGWQWHQLDHMQIICILLQTDNHASTSSLTFYRPDAFSAAQTTASKQGLYTAENILNYSLLR